MTDRYSVEARQQAQKLLLFLDPVRNDSAQLKTSRTSCPRIYNEPRTRYTQGIVTVRMPVNFLIPFQGTPLGGHWELTPQRCLRILAMFRFVFPDVEVRIAGGREIHLRTRRLCANSFAGFDITTMVTCAG